MQLSHLLATGGLFSCSPNHRLQHQFPQQSPVTGGVLPHAIHFAGGDARSLQKAGQEVWGAKIIIINSSIVTFSLEIYYAAVKD